MLVFIPSMFLFNGSFELEVECISLCCSAFLKIKFPLIVFYTIERVIILVPLLPVSQTILTNPDLNHLNLRNGFHKTRG